MPVSLDKSGISQDDHGTISVVQPSIPLLQATVVASGAAMYLTTGMRPNRAYTPTAMRDTLNRISGFKARNLKAALAAYVAYAAEQGVPVTNPRVLAAIA